MQMGLKGPLESSVEPWLCYYCGDCTKTCPRDANPGELMMSLRRYLTSLYDWTGFARKFYTSEKKVETILKVFTVIALFTACLGLIGLASFMAEKRTREIGLRKIFGASVGGMVWLQSWEFSKWILISGVIAGPLAYWTAKDWLSSFAYHFYPGIGILLVTLSVTLLIAIVVVGYQSLKAAMANPVDSLRHE